MKRLPKRSRSGRFVALAAGILAVACHSTMASEGDPQAASGGEQVTIGDIRWYVDYDAALEVAREQDRALWVHFGENPG